MLGKLKNKKGFTLVELMIVIAIICIMTAIAIPNFMHFKLRAKTAEAKSNLGSIRICQEAYKAEELQYKVCRFSPRNIPGLNASKVVWEDLGDGFTSIGFQPNGKVYYSYTVVVNDNNYTCYAIGDLDGDGSYGVFRSSNTNPQIINQFDSVY